MAAGARERKVGARDGGPLRKCVAAGEALPAATRALWKESTGIEIIDGIGATEMFHIFISADEAKARPGATGLVVPGYRARVVDDDGNDVPAGTIGRLAVQGPTGCRYLDDPRQADYVKGGWNYTGDAYVQDADGYFVYQSRTDDMIISAGYNIAAVEVEDVLLRHEAVAECAVIGVADEERGQIVKAFVVLRSGQQGDAAMVKALQDFVKATVAPYKYPRAIEFREALPRTRRGSCRGFGCEPASQAPIVGWAPGSSRAAEDGDPHVVDLAQSLSDRGLRGLEAERRRLDAGVAIALKHLRKTHGVDQPCVDAGRVVGQRRRREQEEAAVEHLLRPAELLDRRHGRCDSEAVVRQRGQRLHPTRLHLRENGRCRRDREVDAAGDQVRQPRIAVGHVPRVDAERLAKARRQQVRRGALAVARVVQPAVAAGQIGQREQAGGLPRPDHDHPGVAVDGADGHEVEEGVERPPVVVQVQVGNVVEPAHQQRPCFGRAGQYRVGGNGTRGARPVDDRTVDPGRAGHRRHEPSGQLVGLAARWRWNHDLQRLQRRRRGMDRAAAARRAIAPSEARRTCRREAFMAGTVGVGTWRHPCRPGLHAQAMRA
jgi:hypothetical protein